VTDQQLLTLAIAIVLPLSMLIYSNTRITDAKETLRAEIALGFERTLHAIATSKTDLQAEIQQLRADLEKHETLKRH
jgi:hypothetical protein